MTVSYRDSVRDQGFLGCSLVVWVIALFVILSLLTLGGYLLRPIFYNLDTQAVRQSNQYVTTQQTQLRSWYTAWQRLDAEIAAGRTPEAQGRAQQRAIVEQMRQAADTMTPDQVPTDVAAFLATH
jgi:hypothetical protein